MRQGAAAPLRSLADAPRLLHELEVHQIELETQNAELLRARGELEAALERYTELYDFAPVGYFTVDRSFLIREANLTGAALLGVTRAQLLQRHLLDFAAPASRARLVEFLSTVFAEPAKQACEALLLKLDGSSFWADLQAVAVDRTEAGSEPCCRVAVSNIAALKRGEEAQRRVETLMVAYESANREIVQRRAAEAALRHSEQSQRRLLKESRELQEQLRLLTHRTIVVQEEERKRISLKLHDEIAQVLAGISIQLTALQDAAAHPAPDLPRRIRRARLLVGQSIRLVHRFARDLRPALLDDLGLVPALRSFVKELAERTGLRIGFKAFRGIENLDAIRSTVLYRVAQEALTNVARHAAAHEVTLQIRKVAGGVRLEVRDDGKSFPPARLLAARNDCRIGISGMRERIEMVGGRFKIIARPGHGTVVHAEIPLATPTASPLPPE